MASVYQYFSQMDEVMQGFQQPPASIGRRVLGYHAED
jgi:hypothetical protein